MLKKQNLVIGKERPVIGRRGRPRLYYTLFPEVAKLIRTTEPTGTQISQQDSSKCSSFPRLNTIKKRLNNRISHSEQKKIISEVESIKEEHEMALRVCNEILEEVKGKVTKIPVK